MDTGEAILRDIISKPDEDMPRLAYADWLQEQGRDRCAEFIRVEMELAKYPSDFEGMTAHKDRFEHYSELCRREWDLLVKPPVWENHYKQVPDGWLLRYVTFGYTHAKDRGRAVGFFTRGFIGRVLCTACEWEAHHEFLCARHPITTVQLVTPYSRHQFVDEFRKRGWYEHAAKVEVRAHWQMFRDLWPTIRFEYVDPISILADRRGRVLEASRHAPQD